MSLTIVALIAGTFGGCLGFLLGFVVCLIAIARLSPTKYDERKERFKPIRQRVEEFLRKG